ncbi:hypothetical protein IBA8401_31590 [Pseudomonas syringae]
MTDLKEVAHLAGVSRATAARAFASPDVVRSETASGYSLRPAPWVFAPIGWAASCVCKPPT